MKNLIQLVENLKKSEVRLIRSLLEVQSLNQKSHKLELFNLIHSKMVKTNVDASMKIYQKKPHAVYYVLKSRLKGDIINSMLYKEVSQVFSTDYVKAKINCRKWLMQGGMLINRKIYGEGLRLLHRAQQLAEQFDLPGEEALINETLRNYYVVREGIDVLNHYNLMIHENNEFYTKHIDSGNLMYLLSIPTLFKAVYSVNKRQIYRHLKRLDDIYNSTKGESERIAFYYHVGYINYYILTRQFNKAKNMCLSFFPLIKNSISLNTISNNGGAHLEMTSVLFRLEEFTEAMLYANKTLQIFREQTFNQILAYEYCFLGNFYTKKHAAATDIFNQVQNIPQINSSVIRKEKWNYLAAYNYYKIGDISKSKELLDNCKNLTVNKSGWYLGKKLLLLIISIQEKEADPTLLKLENLLKLFRTLEEEYIMRFKAIYKVVKFLGNNQFDFKLTLEKQKHYLDLLIEGKADYLWNPLGYEMIRFDEWFMEQFESRER